MTLAPASRIFGHPADAWGLSRSRAGAGGAEHGQGRGLAAYKALNLVVEGEAVESGYVPPVPQIPPPAPSALTAINEE